MSSMQSTSVAVSPFLPTFREWREEVAMEQLMRDLVKVVLIAPAVLTVARLLLFSA